MMKAHQFRFIVTLLAGLAMMGTAGAQQWSGIIDPARAIDWSNAGVQGGIPLRTAICATLSPGATAAQVSAAIAACPANQVVFLNAGTYNFSTGLVFNSKSNITLRGAGADKTILNFTGDNSCTGAPSASICMQSADTSWPGGPSNTANWTAGYIRGATVITLSNKTNLSVGSPLILDQLDDSSDTGNIYICGNASCSDDTDGGPSGGQRVNRNQMQVVTVTAINGNQVTISPGLYMNNWRATQSPGAWWATSPISGDGVEDLSINNQNGTAAAAVTIFNCVGCYVKGIRSTYAGRSHVWVWQGAHITVRDSYFYESRSHASQSYGIEPYPASDMLIENNIFQAVTAPITVNAACSGCVISYNFSVDNVYTASTNWFSQQAFMHAGGIDNLLLEGNVGQGLYSDMFHGSHHFVTAFRNRWSGYEVAGGTARTGNAFPVILRPLSRYYNIIGNVLGTQGFHTSYNMVYEIGTGNVNQWTAGDPQVGNTLFRWGNYDVATGTSRFLTSEAPTGISLYANPVPANQTLPASFYLASRPAWWQGSKPWPGIGPDITGGNLANVAGHASSNPAEDCYLNLMGGPASGIGSALTFNANTCYANFATSAPAPPTNLRVLVQ
jgi:hypothetical protein